MKKCPTAADIDAMRARGFDASVIAEQQTLAERGRALAAIVLATEAAFAGVTLGDGVGLLEAAALDEYAAPDKLAASRARDERLDWQAIPVAELNKYSSSLSFFDAQGMRFHLPAYMLADLRGEGEFDLVYHLTQSPLATEQFALLSPQQKLAVRHYLVCAAEEEEHAYARDHIERALQNEWAES